MKKKTKNKNFLYLKNKRQYILKAIEEDLLDFRARTLDKFHYLVDLMGVDILVTEWKDVPDCIENEEIRQEFIILLERLDRNWEDIEALYEAMRWLKDA